MYILCLTTTLTLAPLLGPTGGGLAALGAGASPPSGAAVVVAAAGGAVSSEALTTSLGKDVFLAENISMLVLCVVVLLLEVTTLGVTNPDAAEAKLQLAMVFLSVFLTNCCGVTAAANTSMNLNLNNRD